MNVPLPANWIVRINSCDSRSLADGHVPGGVGTSQKQDMRLKDDWKGRLERKCQYFGTIFPANDDLSAYY